MVNMIKFKIAVLAMFAIGATSPAQAISVPGPTLSILGSSYEVTFHAGESCTQAYSLLGGCGLGSPFTFTIETDALVAISVLTAWLNDNALSVPFPCGTMGLADPTCFYKVPFRVVNQANQFRDPTPNFFLGSICAGNAASCLVWTNTAVFDADTAGFNAINPGAAWVSFSQVIPEPSTALLMGLGLTGLGWRRRARRA